MTERAGPPVSRGLLCYIGSADQGSIGVCGVRSREVWLKTNYRATLLVLLPFASVLAATVLAIPVFDADWVRGTLAACAVSAACANSTGDLMRLLPNAVAN